MFDRCGRVHKKRGLLQMSVFFRVMGCLWMIPPPRRSLVAHAPRLFRVDAPRFCCTRVFCITWLLCVPVGGIPPRARGAYRKSSGFSHTPLTDVQNRPPHNKKTLLKNLVDGFPKPYRSESAPSFFATELLNLESRSRDVCDNPDD